jgi:protein-S-isoprenylcysteine O-methyltransferase Ste14
VANTENAHQQAPNPFRWLLRVPVPWVFVLAYLLGVGIQHLFPVSVHAPQTEKTIRGLGIAVFAAGAALAAWSLLLFRKERTTTTPGEVSRRLVTWGPYQFSRNPMYVSLTLAYVGEAEILVQIWPVVVLPLVLAYIQWIVIPLEESRLKEAFGEEYEHYRSNVRRWL